MNDPYALERFVTAQASAPDFLGELRVGRKKTHWMWFVFPQVAGLGHSGMAKHYAITSLDEARAYLAHPVLGPRLLECVHLLGTHAGDAEALFGSTDAVKLRSSLTLFARAAPREPAFQLMLERYFEGVADSATDARL